jgi:Raf kinase inhibitor-like YbhB/YbcL family protein
MRGQVVSRSRFVAVFAPLLLLAAQGDVQPLSLAVLAADAVGQRALEVTSDHRFRVTSSTFENNGPIPASMVFNGQLGSTCNGGNQSPQLSWTRSGHHVRSYVVTLFDVTANFAHWGVYNIPPDTTELDAGAGAPGNANLQQVYNDAAIQGYSGPCPPPDIVPNGTHYYVLTVYALDRMLDLAPSPDFPPFADELYRAMIGHVIEEASITGLFSCANASSCP